MRTHRPLPLTASIALLLAAATGRLSAQTTWNNPSTGTWFSAANWTPAAVPTAADNANVTNGGIAQVDGAGAALANVLSIDGGSTVRVIAGSSLTVTQTNIGAGTLEIGNATTTGNYAGAVNFTSATSVLHFANSDTVQGTISGAGQVQVTGGVVTLSGANTYTGGTLISNFATLQASSDSSFGAATGGIVVGNGTIRFLNAFDSARSIAIGNFLGIDTNGFNSTFSGTISGNGTLDKFGAGTLRLTGNNTYSGGTSVEGGVLEISSNSNLGAATGTLSLQGGTLRLLAPMTISRSGVIANGVIDTNGFISTFTGSFSGQGGGLTKTGLGTLVLSGRNTFFGDTFVQQGTLVLDGSVGFDVVVGSGGLGEAQAPLAFVPPVLGGTGTIGGDLFNFGVVSPGNLAGKLTVNGNYTQAANGLLLMQIGGRSPSQFDRMIIGGHATLGGTVEFDTLNNFKPVKGDRFVFLTAAGGVSGQFGQVIVDQPLLKGNVQYSATSAALSFGRQPILPLFQSGGGGGAVALAAGVPPPPVGLTPNEIAVAGDLDRAINDDRLTPVFDRLDKLTLAAIPRALDLIAPEELGAIYEIAIGTADVQAFNLNQHLEDVRGGASGFNAYRFAFGGTPSKDGKASVALDDKSKGSVFTPAPENRWSVFVSGSGEFLDIETTAKASGFGITTGGITVGADYRFGEGFAAGILAGYAGTNTDVEGGGRISVDSGKLGLYATGYNEHFHVNALAEGGYNSYDVRLRSLGGDAHGDTEGGEFSGMISAGYDVHQGKFSFGPLAEGEYTYVAYDGFREHGSAAPLEIESNSSDSFRLRLGGRLATIWGSGTLKLRPEVQVAWQHEFLDTERPTDAQFASGAGNIFRVETPEVGRDSLVVNASLTLFAGDRWSTYLAYYGQLARQNYTSHTISGGVQMSF